MDAIGDTALSEGEVDTCLMSQYEEQLSGHKSEISSVSRDILSIEDADELIERESKLEKTLFDACVKVKRVLQRKPRDVSASTESGVKLPKLDVPNKEVTKDPEGSQLIAFRARRC